MVYSHYLYVFKQCSTPNLLSQKSYQRSFNYLIRGLFSSLISRRCGFLSFSLGLSLPLHHPYRLLFHLHGLQSRCERHVHNATLQQKKTVSVMLISLKVYFLHNYFYILAGVEGLDQFFHSILTIFNFHGSFNFYIFLRCYAFITYIFVSSFRLFFLLGFH